VGIQHRNKNKQTQSINKALHPRNEHRQGYDFLALIKSAPSLAKYVKENNYGNLSIDFANPAAVKELNAALLKHYYNITNWNIPKGALCPPIPGRVDYIHYIADLLKVTPPESKSNNSHSKITLLDIGTGASGIYPILASQIYNWQCVGSDINTQSIENVASIIASNPCLKGRFKLRIQNDKNSIFNGIIQEGEFFNVTVCNPPFHASQDEATKGSKRKLNNLARHRGDKSDTSLTSPILNFGGQEAELWCKGGEIAFLKKLIKESKEFSSQCHWFTSLISKIENVKPAKKIINKLGATDIREIEMKQGNKATRILAWTFI
jgi:23S rRNA (adenine1618-N6)-methyltransferase